MLATALLLVVVLLLALRESSGNRHRSLFTIVQVSGDSSSGADSGTEIYAIIRNTTARKIDDQRTVKTLGYDPSLLQILSVSELRQFQRGAPLPLIAMTASNPDEVMRVEVLKSVELQGDLLHDIQKFGEYINPGVALFHGRFLMFTGLGWTLDNMNDGHPPNELLYNRWVNSSMAPFESKELWGLSQHITLVEPESVLGQDPRVVVTEEGGEEVAHVSFTNRFLVPVRMAKAYVTLNKTTNTVRMRNYLFNIDTSSPHPEKNWMPFVYNRTKVYYVSFVNPMSVVELANFHKRPDNGAPAAGVQVVSAAPRAHLDWHHGELRGGTNALFLPEYGVYLAFHHSSTRLNGNSMTTYFMGAFTFTQHPPFVMLKMSALPIMHEALYTGPWNALKNRHIDYVSFPTSLFRDPTNASELVLVFGFQDQHSMMAKLGLKALMESMVDVPDVRI